jgi:histidinol-phosphate aminotransferase
MRASIVPPRRALSSLNTYVPGKPIWEVQQQLGIQSVIKLASNENPLGASPKALEAMQAMMTEVYRYPDASAIHLKQLISAVYDLPADHVVVSNGADELIKLISEAYIDEGDEVIIPTPTFTEYEFAGKLMGAKIVHVPIGADFEYDIHSLLSAITPRTKMIFICSPNNPTGTYLRRDKLENLLTAVPADILVILDAAYSHYADKSDYTNGVYLIEKGYPIIVIQTLSKVYGLAGIRVGFGLARADIIANLEKVREPFNVNALAQAAAIAALQDTEHLERSRACVTEGRYQLYDIFEGLGLAYIRSTSNFILVDFGEQAKAVYNNLLQVGIIVREGDLWGLPDYLRITIGTFNDNEALGRALQGMYEEGTNS